MIDIAIQKPLDQTLLKRVTHSGGALFISLGLLFVLALAVEAAIGPKTTLLANLDSRAQSVEALEAALENQQAEFNDKLQSIGPIGDGATTAHASIQIVETLGSDADVLLGEIEALGFTLNSRTEPTERAITPSLSMYTLTLNFAGDTASATALVSAPIVSDAHIANLVLTNQVGSAVNLSFNLQRIGASAVQNEGASDE